MFGHAVNIGSLRLSSGSWEGVEVESAGSCLNNKTIEEFELSDGSPCSLISIDPEDVSSFREYVTNAWYFHFSDFQHKNFGYTKNDETAFKEKLHARLEKAKGQFLSGELPLIIIRSRSSIIGGSFYVLMENKSIVLMQIASVDRNISKKDNELCFTKIVGYLSNANYFPDSSKFVVFARNWSEEAELLRRLCTVSDYMLPQYDKNQFTSYERPIEKLHVSEV